MAHNETAAGAICPQHSLFDFFRLFTRSFYQEKQYDADNDETKYRIDKIADHDAFSNFQAGKVRVPADHTEDRRDDVGYQ